MRYCKNCGLLAPFDTDHCPQCGAPLPPESPDPAQPEKTPRYEAEPRETVPALSEWATLGTLLLSFSGPGLEREVEYRGVTLVEVDRGFLDPDYRYYSCRGPLLRGSRPLYCTGEKLLAGLE